MPSRRTLSLFALVSLVASIAFVSWLPVEAAARPSTPRVDDAVFFFAACTHDGYVVVSRYTCGGDSSYALSAMNQSKVYHAPDVESVVLTIKMKDHTTLTQNIPAGTDAVFLSNVAITKFLRPYYERVGDSTKATDLRAFTEHLVTLDRATPRPMQTRAQPARRRP